MTRLTLTVSALWQHSIARLRHRGIRRGFTAIELMVVVAIIAILISLLLPAIQQARESARRTQCQNNLLQIGLALHSYHHTHYTFPPGCVDARGPVRDDGQGYKLSWIVQLLPYLDEGNAYQRIDFNRGAFDQPDEELATYRLALFNCPSSGGTSSYAGCHHDVAAPLDVDNNGMLFLNSRVRFRDVTDGLRHTIILGEAGSSSGWLAGTAATLRNMGGFTDPAGTNYDVAPTRNYYQAPPARPEVSPAEDAATDEEQLRLPGFESAHNAGANFCFVDGSVRFISAFVDEQILLRLAQRADGQLIGEF